MRSGMVVCLVVAGIVQAAGEGPSGSSGQVDEAADRLLQKISAVIRNGMTEARADTPRLTRVTEPEVNAFLSTRAVMPQGVIEPRVVLAPSGQVAGYATMDFDVIRSGRAGGWLDPASYLTGRLPVSATLILHTGDGVGRADIERVEVAGVRMPAVLLRKLVAAYSQTPELPGGIDLNEPFALPYGIREVRITEGEAEIVQ